MNFDEKKTLMNFVFEAFCSIIIIKKKYSYQKSLTVYSITIIAKQINVIKKRIKSKIL